jgi:hypothetical protein
LPSASRRLQAELGVTEVSGIPATPYCITLIAS